MTRDDDLIGFLCDALEVKERAAVEARVRSDPALAARLERLRAALAPLEADRDPPEPPPGLALRTLARLAAHLAVHGPAPGSAGRTRTGRTAAAAAEARPQPPHPEPVPPRFAPLPHAPREVPEARLLGGRLRPDLLVAAGIAFLAFGLLVSGVSKWREQQQIANCQANLRGLHAGLAGYADTHGGRYPQIGLSDTPTAGSFVLVLWQAGQLPAQFLPCCPADTTRAAGVGRTGATGGGGISRTSATGGSGGTGGSDGLLGTPGTPGLSGGVGYTYTLGFRTPGGGITGLRRSDGWPHEHDLVPISADLPPVRADLPPVRAALGEATVSPHGHGLNVLFAGGHVRFTTSPFLGGDDIYRNALGEVAAGLNRGDAVLGRPADRP